MLLEKRETEKKGMSKMLREEKPVCELEKIAEEVLRATSGETERWWQIIYQER